MELVDQGWQRSLADGDRPAIDGALLERARPLALLGGYLNDVTVNSHGRLVLLEGEAGIGKTALLRRFCASQPAQVAVRWAACEPLFAPRPLGPLLPLFGDHDLHERIANSARPDEAARAILQGLNGPTLLVLENLQWADRATLDVLRLLARRLASAPLLVIVTHRGEGQAPDNPARLVLAELGSSRAIARLALNGLSRAAVAQLARGTTIDPDDLHRLTLGNPFLVTEALNAPGERFPATIRDAVQTRCASLSPQAQRVLAAVAIGPSRSEVWFLEALLEESLAGLDECLAARILVAEHGEVAFRHEVVGMVIAQELPLSQATALHRRALRALSQIAAGEADFARLAYHAEAGADAAAVLRFAPLAARDAARRGAHREALSQWTRALRFADRLAKVDRAELLEALADECYAVEPGDEGLRAIDEALAIYQALGDRFGEGRMLQRQARMLLRCDRQDEATAAAERALAVLAPLPRGAELARTWSTLAELALDGMRRADARRWGARAIALAAEVGDDQALVQALTCAGSVELERGEARGRQQLERAVAVAATAGLCADHARAHLNVLVASGRRGDWTTVDQLLPRVIGFCRERDLDGTLREALAVQLESHFLQGRWADAQRCVDELGAAGPAVRFAALTTSALIDARQGEPGYWRRLDQAQGIAAELDRPALHATVAAARAEAAFIDGRPDLIDEETEAAFALARALGDPMALGALWLWRRRAGLTDDPPRKLTAPYRLILEGRPAAAAERWRQAGRPYEAALALIDGGDTQGLLTAMEALQALGARAAAAIAARHLRGLGIRGLARGPRPQTRANPAGLTPRQLDVLALLGEGLRNAQIAERLVLSEKTVDHHVSAILRKLDVCSRHAAGLEAVRLGIGADAVGVEARESDSEPAQPRQLRPTLVEPFSRAS